MFSLIGKHFCPCIDCKLTSYRIARSSSHTRQVNDFVRRFIEFGFYDKVLEWNNRLGDAMYEAYRDKMLTDEFQNALTLVMANDVFVLYVMGNLMGCVAFAGELIFKLLMTKGTKRWESFIKCNGFASVFCFWFSVCIWNKERFWFSFPIVKSGTWTRL